MTRLLKLSLKGKKDVYYIFDKSLVFTLNVSSGHVIVF